VSYSKKLIVESELMKTSMQSFLSGLVLIGLTGGATAYAQNSPASSVQQNMQAAVSPEMMKARIEKNQAELHDKLKITSGQESAWKTFIQVVAAEHVTPEKDVNTDKMTTPERMQKTLEKMKEHQGQLQQKLDATKTFYAVLTPEQQKIFDNSHRHVKKDMQERMAKQMQKKEGLMTDKP